MARVAGTCYFKIDGQQLSLTGGIEVPMNKTVNDDIIGMAGDVDRKETHRAPYVTGQPGKQNRTGEASQWLSLN